MDLSLFFRLGFSSPFTFVKMHMFLSLIVFLMLFGIKYLTK